MPATHVHILTNFERCSDPRAIKIRDKAIKDATSKETGELNATWAWRLFTDRMLEKGLGAQIPGTVGNQFRPRQPRGRKPATPKPFRGVPYSDLTYADLRGLAVEHGVKASGTKRDVLLRLVHAKVMNLPWGTPSDHSVCV